MAQSTMVGNQDASAAILQDHDELTASVVALEFQRHPELETRFGSIAHERSLNEAGDHLAYLAQAVAVGHPALFRDYIGWAKVLFAQREATPSDLQFQLECLREVLEGRLKPDQRPAVLAVLDETLAALPGMPDQLPTFIAADTPHARLAHRYLQALLRGERRAASSLILDAVERGIPLQEVYLHVFQRSQYEIGRLWQSAEISVAQEHYCTAATQLIMSQLYPRIFAGDKTEGVLVATAVAGDLHELGIRMIADFFEMAGWDTYYLGASTPASSVVQAVIERRATVLGISATITYHVKFVEELIREVRATPACAKVTILVGGYPFNVAPDLWRTVGADGHAINATEVIALAERLTGRRAS